MTPGTLIIADDHPLFRAALREAVAQLLEGVQIVEASDAVELHSVVQANPTADLLLMDLHMPGANVEFTQINTYKKT